MSGGIPRSFFVIFAKIGFIWNSSIVSAMKTSTGSGLLASDFKFICPGTQLVFGVFQMKAAKLYIKL